MKSLQHHIEETLKFKISRDTAPAAQNDVEYILSNYVTEVPKEYNTIGSKFYHFNSADDFIGVLDEIGVKYKRIDKDTHAPSMRRYIPVIKLQLDKCFNYKGEDLNEFWLGNYHPDKEDGCWHIQLFFGLGYGSRLQHLIHNLPAPPKRITNEEDKENTILYYYSGFTEAEYEDIIDLFDQMYKYYKLGEE